MHVTALATISLDGRITPPDASGTEYASPETGANFRDLLMSTDATVTGRATYQHERERMLQMMAAVPESPVTVVMTSQPDRYRDPSLPEVIEFTDADPATIVGDLKARGHQSLLVLGGSYAYAAFAPVVDEWQLAVEPLILGGGTPLFSDVARTDLRLLDHRPLNDSTLLLRYAAMR